MTLIHDSGGPHFHCSRLNTHQIYPERVSIGRKPFATTLYVLTGLNPFATTLYVLTGSRFETLFCSCIVNTLADKDGI